MFRDKDPKKSNDKWRIIVDEGLMKIESFPHFFHGDYCVPRVSAIKHKLRKLCYDIRQIESLLLLLLFHIYI